MKILFVGLGSIGRRHLHLLQELISIDAWHLPSGVGNNKKIAVPPSLVKQVHSWNEALRQKPDGVVVATPTHEHLAAASKLLEAGIPFLLEKPVADTEAGLVRLANLQAANSLPVLVGYQLRYHPHFRILRQWLHDKRIGKVSSCLAEVGQWLPDWRPDQDYRQSYSANLETGGGVIFDLSHELDLMTSLFGKPNKVSCVLGHTSTLETTAEDVAEISLSYSQGLISHIHMDCVQRSYCRSLKVVGTEGTIFWNYAAGFLEITPSIGDGERLELPKDFSKDSLLKSQLTHWMDVLNGKTKPEVDLAQGIVVAGLALAAHRSAKEGKQVTFE